MPQSLEPKSQWSGFDLVHKDRRLNIHAYYIYGIVNALGTSVHEPSWENIETQSSLMYVSWPSFLNMWRLTYFPHEITHASALLSFFIDGHFQLSDYGGKRYYVINTAATSAKNPLGMHHINCQTLHWLWSKVHTVWYLTHCPARIHMPFHVCSCVIGDSQRHVASTLSGCYCSLLAAL